MSLIIFLFLAAIILGLKLGDSSAAYESKKTVEDWESAIRRFHNQYGDKALEEDLIEARFYDEKLAPKVIEELGKALKEIPGLEDLDPKGLVFFGTDILLANRGYISQDALEYGYDNYYDSVRYEGHLDDLILWLQETFRKQGKDAELVALLPYDMDKPNVHMGYVWKGSHAYSKIETYSSGCFGFKVALVLPAESYIDQKRTEAARRASRSVNIPKPYYEE